MIGLPTRASNICRSKPAIIPNSSSSKKRPKDHTFGWMAWGPQGGRCGCGGSGPLVPQEVDISSCSWVAESPGRAPMEWRWKESALCFQVFHSNAT